LDKSSDNEKKNDKLIRCLKDAFNKKMNTLVDNELCEAGIKKKEFGFQIGESGQVVSSILSPSTYRTITLFEGLRYMVVMRKPLFDLIPLSYYMTQDEIDDQELMEDLFLSGEMGLDEDQAVLFLLYERMDERAKKEFLAIGKSLTGFRD